MSRHEGEEPRRHNATKGALSFIYGYLIQVACFTTGIKATQMKNDNMLIKTPSGAALLVERGEAPGKKVNPRKNPEAINRTNGNNPGRGIGGNGRKEKNHQDAKALRGH